MGPPVRHREGQSGRRRKSVLREIFLSVYARLSPTRCVRPIPAISLLPCRERVIEPQIVQFL
jgi:hypothetical protein